MKSIRIATRNSPLALWQAHYIEQRLLETHQGLSVEIVSMTTKGDQLLDRSLAAVGGKGLFLKELEVSLLNKETDIAVHSMKDVPVELPKGLEIAVVCERENPRDAFVSNYYQNLYALPKGSKVGTSSLRRISQLKNSFPDLEFIELRGNVNTRLSRLDDGDYDAIILAAAGLIRLDFADRIKQYISPLLCLPAVGQGIVGIECRSDDEAVKQLIAPLHSRASAIAIEAERTMNAELEGGCQLPVAGFAEINKGKIRLRGMVGKVDGSELLFTDSVVKSMTMASAATLGRNAAKDLLQQGAADILSSAYHKPTEYAKQEQPLVILTREEKFLGNTPALLQSLDYQPKHIEALSVEPTYDEEVLSLFNNMEQFTDVLFVSRNAVELSVPMIEQQSDVLKSIRVMAVGPETAQQLYQFQIDALVPDSGHGAEALLKVQQLQELSGRKILIVRGKFGLDWPAEKMQERGAEVVSALCYQQVEPVSLGVQIKELFSKAASPQVKGIFLHSSISAINILSHIVQYPDKIRDTKLIVGSDQIATTARDFGWTNEIRVAQSPSNKHMMIAFSG
ncbi:UNVERIFIED_CONTAM: hypothetical protein GTU68_043190 [Idotea baltica]|nr:hypothetical protein [Idotea baltica]